MQTFLKLLSNEIFPISRIPKTREEAIAIITPHIVLPGQQGVFRIFAVDEVDLPSRELCEVEVFAVAFRRYSGGTWGLVEASSEAVQLTSEFSPTVIDVALWLKALRACLHSPLDDFFSSLDPIDDFHVLQCFQGKRLLSSVTWNASDTHTAFQMPSTLDTANHLWGDGFLPDVGLVYQALDEIGCFSLRK